MAYNWIFELTVVIIINNNYHLLQAIVLVVEAVILAVVGWILFVAPHIIIRTSCSISSSSIDINCGSSILL